MKKIDISMLKDRRIKSCTNRECVSWMTHRRYRPEENFCSMCGQPLSYVCADCYRKIDDLGPHRRYCDECATAREIRRENARSSVRETAEMTVGAVASLGRSIEQHISDIAENRRERN